MSFTVTRPAADARSSRSLGVVTGAGVVAVCLAYAGWSLLTGSADEAGPAEEGVALGTGTAPELAPTPEEPPRARLYLDDGTEPGYLPVVNAYHEVSDAAGEVAPAMEQLGFAAEPVRPRPAGAVGAWLTGRIEVTPAVSASRRAAH